ncbi:crustapain-like [Leguminivora glycinivorella]|uniref:crustapain-like n=1 Tax=Leguminivora glycinivorella TaxID=1035111 RepID=UPI00200E5DAE|nr:crustapain-like [Leguminivora glycinivorella]
MRTQGVEHKYIRLIRNVYNNSTSCIQLEKKGDIFRIQKGVRFADDIVLFAKSPEELDVMINELSQESLKVGLGMNLEKTKLMTNGEKHVIMVGENTIEYVEEYIYLGQIISPHDAIEKEVERRAVNGWKNFALGWYPQYDLEKAEEHFADFIEKYDKKYESAEEIQKRFEIFKKRLENINEWNKNNKYTNVWYAVNQFADQEELKPLDQSAIRNTTKVIEVEKEFILNAPDELDYRNQNLVTEVKDQSTCLICYVFAAIGAVEGMHAKKSGGDLQSLSEQQVLDCTSAVCEHGGMPVDALNEMAGKKLMTELDYPFTPKKGNCRADPSKGKVNVNGGTVINTPDIESLKGALYGNGAPIVVGLYAGSQLQACTGPGVCSPNDCTAGQQLNHAVLLIGYGKDAASGKSYWLFKNSWGTGVGDQGFFKLDMSCPCGLGSAYTTTADAD